MSDTLADAAERPLTAFERAVDGDASGFLELAAQHYAYALDGHEPPAVAYAQAVVYIRFAAAMGSEEAAICFLYSLDMLADALRNDGWEEAADVRLGEAIAIAEGLAKQGFEEFGDMVLKAADMAPRRAMEIAGFFSETTVN